MARYDEQFRAVLTTARFEPKNLDHSRDSIVGLWPDLAMAYFNDGWFAFARENRGEPAISEQWGLGRSLLEAIPEQLQEFYRSAFLESLASHEPWGHEYECSSPDYYRLLHQQVFPLGAGEGLLVIHSISVLVPYPRPPGPVSRDDFVGNDGISVQCCHCRKFQNVRAKNQWTWIADWVRSPPERISHGFCKYCLEFYYPEMKRFLSTPRH